jgi:hypothetical protein
MRAGASLGLRIATAVAFGATAALAVILNHSAPVHAALASEKAKKATPAAAAHSSAAATQSTAVTTQSPATAPRCAVSGLRISVGAGSRVTTAMTRYPLDFTNVSRASCTLTGYPQVAAYQGDDKEVGDAAAMDTSVEVLRVVLAPGQTAHASLDASLSARCRPVRVAGLRVVSPGQSAARYVKRSLTACAAHAPSGEDYLHVHAIQPGNGSRGEPAAAP